MTICMDKNDFLPLKIRQLLVVRCIESKIYITHTNRHGTMFFKGFATRITLFFTLRRKAQKICVLAWFF